jgi:hypothetical protein
VGTPATALPAFKVPIAGGSASLAGIQDIWIHSQAHGASGFTPFKPCFAKDLIYTFGLGCAFNIL